jgi:hypothetical protein
LAVARGARALPQGLELVWSAPDGCPGEQEVLAAVERLAGGRDAALSRPLRAVARVEKHENGFRLALTWSTATASAVRTLEGATCAEVAQAAAVVVALAADPATNLEELAAEPDELAAPPPLAPPPPAAPPPASPRPRDTPRPARPAPPRENAAFLRAGAALDLGSLPRPAPGLLLGGELAASPFFFVLDALTFIPMDEVVPEGAGRFWLSALSLRPCFRASALAFRISPCVAAEAHLLLGQGDRVDFPDDHWAFYVRLGGGIEVSAPLSSRLELVASGFVLGALSRPTFVIGDGTPVHEPAAVSGRLSLGFALKL